MSSPLQKFPRALLGAFDLKTLGKAPDKFGDLVGPNIDVRDFYLLPQFEIQQKNITVTNPAANAADTFDVPQGETWALWGMGISGTLAAADAALAVTGIFSINDGVSQVPFSFQSLGPATVTRARAGGLWRPTPLFIPSGWGLLCGVEFNTAAPAVSATFAISIAFLRIRE